MADNTTLLNSYHYLLATMLVVMLLVVYQVFFVHRPVCKMVQRMLGEGMGNAPHHWGASYDSVDSARGPPGVSGLRLDGGEGFLNSYEPPTFWPIGSVDEVRGTRSRSQYSVKNGVLYDDTGKALNNEYPEPMTSWKRVEGMTSTPDVIRAREENPYVQ